MQKWSKIEIKNEVKQINHTITARDNKIILIEDGSGKIIKHDNRGIMFDIGRGNQSTFSSQDFIDAGWLLHDYDLPGVNQYHGDNLIIEETRINKEILDRTPAEIRASLNAENYQRCSGTLSAAVDRYSNAEMSQWAEMVKEAQAGNWSYFDSMATPGLTGEQYAAVVLQKYAEYKSLFDGCLSARNTHKVNIAATADADLKDYDITTMWTI